MSDHSNPARQKQHLRPPVHHVHSLQPVAGLHGDDKPQLYVGDWGSISIDYKNQFLRIHDNTTRGGVALVPFYANPMLNVPWPFTPLTFNPVALTQDVPVLITHNFGRPPIVAVYDVATMQQIDVKVTLTDLNNAFTVTADDTVTVMVVVH